MLKIKSWIVEEKKHVRFYHDWNDKEVLLSFFGNLFLKKSITCCVDQWMDGFSLQLMNC